MNAARCGDRLPQRRRGFTLVELLVVISILTILAAITYGGLTAAWGVAKETKTRSTIAKLHHIIMAKYEALRTLRPPIDLEGYVDACASKNKYYLNSGLPSGLTTASQYGRYLARARLNAMRDYTRMSLPDRWSDVFNQTGQGKTSVPSTSSDVAGFSVNSNIGNATLIRNPSDNSAALSPPAECAYCEQMYLNAFQKLHQAGMQDSDVYAKLSSHANAKLLYLIVAATPDGLRQFDDSETADLDGDGLKVFVDGWKQPIYFLRWPAGYIPALKATTTLQTGDYTKDHDPFDPQRIDTSAYALYPLIYSGGPDQQLDINVGHSSGDNTYIYGLNSTGDLMTCANDGGNHLIGMPLNGDTQTTTSLRHYDNITNHDLQTR